MSFRQMLNPNAMMRRLATAFLLFTAAAFTGVTQAAANAANPVKLNIQTAVTQVDAYQASVFFEATALEDAMVLPNEVGWQTNDAIENSVYVLQNAPADTENLLEMSSMTPVHEVGWQNSSVKFGVSTENSVNSSGLANVISVNEAPSGNASWAHVVS